MQSAGETRRCEQMGKGREVDGTRKWSKKMGRVRVLSIAPRISGGPPTKRGVHTPKAGADFF